MKKRISKHLCVFIVFVMMLQLFVPTSVLAEDCVIKLSSPQARLGEEVTLSLSVQNNPSLAGVTLCLLYDNSMITPVSISTEGSDVEGSLKSNIEEPGVDLSALSAVKVVWSTVIKNSSDGVLWNIKFKVKESANNYIPITLLKQDAADIFDNDFNKINAELVSGEIHVADAEPPDKTELISTIASVKEYLEDDKYTSESLSNLKNIVDTAQRVADNTFATETEIMSATEDVKAAISKLVIKMFWVNVEKSGQTNLKTGYRMISYGELFSEQIGVNEGYELSGVYVNDIPTELDSNNFLTIPDLKENKRVVVTTKAIKYKINVKEADNGKISVNSTEIPYGKACIIKAEPNTGYILKDLIVDDQRLGAQSQYVIENVKEEHWVSAVFEEQLKPVKVSAKVRGDEGGKISPMMSIVNSGYAAAFVTTPDYGYDISHAIINSDTRHDITDNILILDNITEDTTVEAVFVKKKYNVSIAFDETEGSARIVGNATVPYLDTVEVEIMPNRLYKFKSIFVNGVSTKASKRADGQLICRVKITGDTKIDVKFIKDVYSEYKEKVTKAGVPSNVNASNAIEKKELFEKLVQEYLALDDEQRHACSGEYATVLAGLERANGYIMLAESEVESRIAQLPEAEAITAQTYKYYEEETKAIKSAYDNLTVLAKKLMQYDLQKKLESIMTKIERYEQDAAGKIKYFSDTVTGVSDVITQENIGEEYTQLKKAESIYNALTAAEKSDVDGETVQLMYSKMGSIIGMLYEWYVNPFVKAVDKMEVITPELSIDVAEASRARIYELNNEYDMFAGYIRDLISESTRLKLDMLYESASSVVSQSLDSGEEIQASGDIDVAAELAVENAAGNEHIGSIIADGVAIDKAVDIKLTKNGEAIQPSSKIRIKVPVNATVAVGEPYVMYIDDNGTMYDVQARVVEEDGQKYIVWDTDHFSCFAILYSNPNNGITFNTTEFPNIGDKVVATVDSSVDQEGCTLFIGCYNQDGVLEHVAIGKNGSVSTVTTAKTTHIKAMLWKNNLKPVAFAELSDEN